MNPEATDRIHDLFSSKKRWKVATDFEAEDGTIADRLEPQDKTAKTIALEYAEKWDIGCGDRPIIYEKQELVVYVMETNRFDESIPFAEQAITFVIRGQLIPEYYVSND